MGTKNIKLCRFKNCPHKTKEIDIETEEFIHPEKSSAYYHKDCWGIKEDINKIKELWIENISDTVVFSNLIQVINTIIFKKHVSSEFLVFAMEYVIKNKIPLRYPNGLYYIIDNDKIKNSWNKKKNRQILKENQFYTGVKDEREPQFVIINKNHGFGSIFGGE